MGMSNSAYCPPSRCWPPAQLPATHRSGAT
jgi:hypothetical protein